MIQVGSQVYIVPNDTRDKPYYAVVTKIGHKYITVDDGYYNRFNIHDHRSADYNGWNPRLKLYESKEAYCEEIRERATCDHLLIKIKANLPYASIEQLENILKILKK